MNCPWLYNFFIIFENKNKKHEKLVNKLNNVEYNAMI